MGVGKRGADRSESEMEHSFFVSILFIKEFFEDQSGWVAQCLEYDIAAQGKTIKEAKIAFERTFVGQVVTDIFHQKKPLEGIPKAPSEYWVEFRRGDQLADNSRAFFLPESLPPELFIQANAHDMRVT